LTRLDRVCATNDKRGLVRVVVRGERAGSTVNEVALILGGHLNVEVIVPRVRLAKDVAHVDVVGVCVYRLNRVVPHILVGVLREIATAAAGVEQITAMVG